MGASRQDLGEKLAVAAHLGATGGGGSEEASPPQQLLLLLRAIRRRPAASSGKCCWLLRLLLPLPLFFLSDFLGFSLSPPRI
jgi:hypothetical protein